MVRLDEFPTLLLPHFYIPISIPCGTIRSMKVKLLKKIRNTFQFLVVRLEGRLNNMKTLILSISIPCGTIRRHETER